MAGDTRMREARMPIRVVQYGLGPIGCAAARAVVARERLQLVGAVDIDPQKIGRDAGEVLGVGRILGIEVAATLQAALQQSAADVVLHTTGSFLDVVGGQLAEILSLGLDVVSSTEELCYPWADHDQYAQQIDRAAVQAGRTVLGTGVNPGFLMDTLPLNLTAICFSVRHIAVTRVIDASKRRGPFQTKIGAGMTVLAAGKETNGEHIDIAQKLFDAVGKTLVLDEKHFDAVTGLSASGPAFIYVIIEALAEGGVKCGLPRDVSTALVTQACLGSAQMVSETGMHPAILKDHVTTPAGCTIDGLLKLEEGGLRVTLIKAVDEAARRAKELGNE